MLNCSAVLVVLNLEHQHVLLEKFTMFIRQNYLILRILINPLVQEMDI